MPTIMISLKIDKDNRAYIKTVDSSTIHCEDINMIAKDMLEHLLQDFEDKENGVIKE